MDHAYIYWYNLMWKQLYLFYNDFFYRDSDHEINNQVYCSVDNEIKIKCINYQLCEEFLNSRFIETYETYYCMNCDVFAYHQPAWQELVFEEKKESCCVCLGNDKIQV